MLIESLPGIKRNRIGYRDRSDKNGNWEGTRFWVKDGGPLQTYTSTEPEETTLLKKRAGIHNRLHNVAEAVMAEGTPEDPGNYEKRVAANDRGLPYQLKHHGSRVRRRLR